MSTDPATGLFLGDLTAKVLADTLSAASAIEQIGVFTRPYPVALITLDPDAIGDWAKANGMDVVTQDDDFDVIEGAGGPSVIRV